MKTKQLSLRELAEMLIASTMTGIDEVIYEKDFLLRTPEEQKTIKSYISVNSHSVHEKLEKLQEENNQTIPGISSELSQHIDNLLKMDAFKAQRDNKRDDSIMDAGEASEKYLVSVGLIDNDEQFVEPEKFEGELKIAAQWLKDNI